HVILPLIAINDQTYQTSKGLWYRKCGELLRPDSFSPEDLNELRASSFNPDFGMLYQQDIESQGLPSITGAHFPSFSELQRFCGAIEVSINPRGSNPRTH